MTEHTLGPGIRRLRPDDHFMILAETDATPMQIGALVFLDVAGADRAGVFAALRDHLLARLAHTPLLAVLHEAPDGYDSDVWVDVADIDIDKHIQRVSEPLDAARLRRFVADKAMERLDLSRPPFRIVVFDNLPGGEAALHLTVHHAVTDGVGFQTLLGLLSDDTEPATATRQAGALPTPEIWRAAADARFTALDEARASRRALTDQALTMLRSGSLPPRGVTPTLKLSGPTSPQRAYATLSLPFERVRALGKALKGTVNDVFLALAASALRRYLLDIDDLPTTPIMVNSARSYRRPAHGDFSNRIVAMHPHLATHLADPLDRLRAIQNAMADERARTPYDEALLDAPEKPYGARDRRARFADKTRGGAAVLPGNVTLSNVPGPSDARSWAGFRQIANYPTPLLGSGRFLNITSRRNGDNLDLGLMADPTKIGDVDRLAGYLAEALAEYEGLTRAPASR